MGKVILICLDRVDLKQTLPLPRWRMVLIWHVTFCMSKWQDSEVTVHAPVVLLWVTVKCIMIISLSSMCFSALYIFEICTHFLQTVLMYCAIKDVRLLTHTIYVHCIELQPQAATGDNFIHPTRWNWFERLVNWKTQEGKKKKRRISFSCMWFFEKNKIKLVSVILHRADWTPAGHVAGNTYLYLSEGSQF